MNISDNIDYSIIHHSALLNDKNRIELFKKALQEKVSPKSLVVDIGSGTGILAALSATLTTNTVYAIEYYEFSEKLAKAILSKSHYKNIQYLKGNAFDITLEKNPDILLTETIGQIGPEEHIVEICCDFFKRHPDIKELIPQKLCVYAELISSNIGEKFVSHLVQGYLNASLPGYDYGVIEEDIYNQLSQFIFQSKLSDATSLSEPILLAEYHLGKTSSSTFTKEITIPNNLEEKLVHLYFTAHLTDTIILSSRFNFETHWQHSFVPISKNSQSCVISYLAGSGQIKIHWK